jgi:methyltransferase (TIGR00027 family)
MTAPDPSPRTASRTALGVAAHRAMHKLFDGEPKILDDPVALRLLGDPTPAQLEASRRRPHSPAARDLRTHVVLRSRFSEDRLAAAAGRGVRQAVTLGAGYDSFAYRQPAWASGLRLFEVDQPATQADKRRRLAAAGVDIPSNLAFVAIDFERTSLEDGLRASSLDFSAPTFFSCLGVFVYLTRPAIEAIFRLVAGFPAGSEIAFTFSPSRLGMLSSAALAASAAGEPWLTRLSREDVVKLAGDLGFGPVAFLDPPAAKAAYFTPPRRDGLTAPRVASIAAAIVGPRPGTATT